VPESLGSLTALTRPDLAGNELTVVPESLGSLTALTRLDLAGNRLVVLPSWLREPAADEHRASAPVRAWGDGDSDGDGVADPDGLDAVLDRGSPGVTLISEDGRRALYLMLDGDESWLSWEGDHDVLLSWGPVPPGAAAGQVIGDYEGALSDPWFSPGGGDEPLGVPRTWHARQVTSSCAPAGVPAAFSGWRNPDTQQRPDAIVHGAGEQAAEDEVPLPACVRAGMDALREGSAARGTCGRRGIRAVYCSVPADVSSI
jgi:hypothetical protein